MTLPSENADKAPSPSARPLKGALLAGLFCFLIYLALIRYAELRQNGQWNWNAFVTGNEFSHFALIRALVEGRTFALDNFRERPADLSFYNNHYYSNKPPGFALLLAPFYVVCNKLIALWNPGVVPDFLPVFPAMMGGLVVTLTYLLAADLGAKRHSAMFVALVSGLATLVVVYAISFMNNIASALFLLLAMWTAFKYRATQRLPFLLGSAFSIGYSILINFSSAAVLFPLGLYLLWIFYQRRQAPELRREVGIAIVIGALPLLFLAFYNAVCFGNPFVTAYSHYQAPDYVQFDGPLDAYTGGSLLTGLWGFLFSASRGLFVYTPILGLALPGLYFALREPSRRAEWLTLMSVTAANILVFAQYRYWFGGHILGPRHILPILPLIAVLMYPALERLPRLLCSLAGVAALPSIVTHLMLVFLQHDGRALAMSWLQNENDRLGSLYTEVLPLFRDTPIDVWGVGAFRSAKLILLVLVIVTASLLGAWWRANDDRA